jgi:hypothetical protein
MDKDLSPMLPDVPPRQSLWQRLRAKLILWGLLPPPGDEEEGLTEKEQAIRRRMFLRWRHHPGGGR